MRRALVSSCLLLVGCSSRPVPLTAPPARAPAAVATPAAPAPAFPPLGTIAAPAVRAWAGAPAVIRAPVPTAPVVKVAPAASTPAMRADLDRQLRALERVVGAAPSLPEQLRLAELYQRRAVLAEPTEARRLHDQARAVLAAAVSVATNRTLPGFDAALLSYGTLLAEVDVAAGRKVMLELVKSFPSSPQVAAVYLHFAEHYFNAGDVARAEPFYRKVILLDRPETREYARYKLAWTEWNLGNGAEALAALVSVIGSDTSGDAADRLRSEARKDLPRFYAQVGAAAKARAFFARTVAGHEVDALDRLAEAYEDVGKYEESREVYLHLARDVPGDVRVCVWWQGASRSAEALGQLDAMADAASRLITEPACRADPAVRDTVGSLARRLHAEALATREPRALARVTALYGGYLSGAGDAADAGLVRYYHAHLRWSDAMSLRDPEPAIEAWEGLALQCAEAVSSGLDPADVTGAATCALAAIENAVAVAVAFDRLTPALSARLVTSLESVATASGSPERVGELREHLRR